MPVATTPTMAKRTNSPVNLDDKSCLILSFPPVFFSLNTLNPIGVQK